MSETSSPELFRLFIAISVPDAVKTEMEKAQAELRRGLPEGCVRWTRREQFHLTLKFLGNVEAQRVEALAGAIRGACQGFTALRLRAERIGCFPDLRFPRVVWAWVHDRQEQLPRLQQGIETASRDFTTEAPEERFTGHVTLGRARGIKRREAGVLAKVVAGMVETAFGEWIAAQIEIMRSEMSPKGARHSVLSTVQLHSP
ncbi:MAG: 2,3-cyclic 3-phosphodiesterase [Verrucomicrobiota bacterium]